MRPSVPKTKKKHHPLVRVLRGLIGLVLGLLAFVALYFVAAWVLSRFGAEEEAGQPDEVTIFLRTNGVHTDLVVPARHRLRHWPAALPFSDTRGGDSTAQWVGLGWGDRGFYLETPTWADLKASTALRAATGMSRTAIHATYYRDVRPAKGCVAVRISEAQYARLLRFVDASFDADSAGRPVVIPTDARYGDADAFYEARGSYSLFRTCNVWTNNALKACGQKAAVWAPFDWCIFHRYRA